MSKMCNLDVLRREIARYAPQRRTMQMCIIKAPEDRSMYGMDHVVPGGLWKGWSYINYPMPSPMDCLKIYVAGGAVFPMAEWARVP